MTKSDGTYLQAGDKVSPVNLFLPSLFSIAEMTLQNKVTTICNRYPYIAIIQTLLNYGEDANLPQTAAEMFVKDDPDVPSDTDPAGANSGLLERSKFVELSKVLDICDPI